MLGQDTPRSPACSVPVVSRPRVPPRSRIHCSRAAVQVMAAPDKGGNVEKQFLTPLLRSPRTAALSPAGCRRSDQVERRQGATLPEPAREQAGLVVLGRNNPSLYTVNG